jgi:hypothetical protein
MVSPCDLAVLVDAPQSAACLIPKQRSHRVVAGPASGLNHIVDVTPAHIAGRQPGPKPASQRRPEGHRVSQPRPGGEKAMCDA